jgi:DNA-directed RNA polymerase subunit H (RpoH/RPB5)
MNEKKNIAQKLLNSFKNMSSEAPQILQKIITTLFEKDIGLFPKRNIQPITNIISLNDSKVGTIEEIINNQVNFEGKSYNLQKFDGLEIDMKNIKIYIVLDVKKTHKISKDFQEFEDNFEYAKNYENNNILIISLMELNKTQQEVPIFYYYKDLLFNLTKNKYVPHIEKVEASEIANITAFSEKDIEDNNLPKIKRSDKLIKFYGFSKSSICKITYKINKIKDIDLYCNYRIVI